MADGRTDLFPLPVGERLRVAREAKGLTLEDIASQTRIPMRHLENMEEGKWDNLPAPTYSIGFAKSFADLVGLDRQEIGDDLRAELGGGRVIGTPDTFQPADPARVPPRTLAIIAAVIAVLLLAGYGYYRTMTLGDVQPQLVDYAGDADAPALTPQGAAVPPSSMTPLTPAIDGPVVITAREEVWIKVYERSGAVISEEILKSGQAYEVPATAVDPLLRTSRAELLRISVGTADVPEIGPPSTLVKDVSLRPAALLQEPGSSQAETPPRADGSPRADGAPRAGAPAVRP